MSARRGEAVQTDSGKEVVKGEKGAMKKAPLGGRTSGSSLLGEEGEPFLAL